MRLKMIVFTIVSSFWLSAAIAQDINDRQLQKLYVKSGLEKQIAQFPLLMQAGFDEALEGDNNLKSMPPGTVNVIRSSIGTVFSSDEFKQIILDDLDEKLNNDDIESVLEWLDSPAGRQFTLLEEAASTPEKYNEMQEFALQMQNSPPDSERLEMIQRLDSALKATESGVEVAMNMQRAIGIAIVSSLPREQQPSYDALSASIEQLRPQMENTIRAQTLVSLLYTYRSASQEDLAGYISFASSPAGTKYHTAVMSGLEKALVKGSYQLGEKISTTLRQSTNESDV
jgi:hypothetical protein